METLHITKKMSLFFILVLAFQLAAAQFGKANKVKLPNTYNFDYIYKLKMTHKKGDITFDYYLKKDAKYFGFESEELTKANPEAKIFMVMDTELQVTAMFMDMMGRKIVQKTKMKPSVDTDSGENLNFTYKKIGTKTINGYECDGYVGENDKMKITFYITDDVPVSFSQIFGTDIKKLPKGFDASWLKKYAENGLMMEMIYEDKKKPKNNMTMQCTALEKTDFSIDTTVYKGMF